MEDEEDFNVGREFTDLRRLDGFFRCRCFTLDDPPTPTSIIVMPGTALGFLVLGLLEEDAEDVVDLDDLSDVRLLLLS